MTDPAASLIAEAFYDIAPAQWIVPDDTVRRHVIAAQFEILVDHGRKYGQVHMDDDGDAVAVWIDNTTDVPEIENYDERLAAAVGDWLPRFQKFDAALLAHHPHEPHYHLALLAVRPDKQSQGRGGRLMRRQHEWLDQRGIPAYLEASNLRSSELYRRHGYEPLGEPYHLPNDGPPMFPMWRSATRG